MTPSLLETPFLQQFTPLPFACSAAFESGSPSRQPGLPGLTYGGITTNRVSRGGRGPGTVRSCVFKMANGDSVGVQLSHLGLPLCPLPPTAPSVFLYCLHIEDDFSQRGQTLNHMSKPLWRGSEHCVVGIIILVWSQHGKFSSLCFIFKYFFKRPTEISDGENEVGKSKPNLKRRSRTGVWGSAAGRKRRWGPALVTPCFLGDRPLPAQPRLWSRGENSNSLGISKHKAKINDCLQRWKGLTSNRCLHASFSWGTLASHWEGNIS